MMLYGLSRVVFPRRRPTLRRRGTVSTNVVCETLETRVLLSADPLRFDFGTASSPVEAGYTPVTRSTVYTAGMGYGWSSSVKDVDRGGDALTGDLNYFGSGTFSVGLANGTYDVSVTLGDAGAKRDQMAVALEGVQVDLVTTEKGQFHRGTYRVDVTDGQLTLRLDDLGGVSSSFAVNALEIAAVGDPDPEPGTYYVSATGSDSAAGTNLTPFRSIGHALSVVRAGETIIVRAGTYSESLATRVAGTAENWITVRAEQAGAVLVTGSGRVLDVAHAFYTFEGLVFDGQFGASDIVRVGGAGDSLQFLSNEVRRGRRDGIDIAGADDVLIQDSTIHELLWFEGGIREDAHGIVTVGGRNLTIRGTEVYYVSGDALQLQYGGWDNARVESSHFWNGPLPANVANLAGAPVGSNPGENAIDTKQYGNVPLGRLTVTGSVFNGWHSDFISNAAALVLKHNVDVIVDGNTFFDNEIALRLRGPGSLPGARVLAMNNVFYANLTAIRYEDRIENLRVYNNTFGGGNGRFFQSAGGHGAGFSVLNNLFLAGSKPSEAAHASNLAVTAASFANAAAHDYHLVFASAAVDAGVAIPEVTQDREGRPRPSGDGFDVGAHEFTLWQVLAESPDLLLGAPSR